MKRVLILTDDELDQLIEWGDDAKAKADYDGVPGNWADEDAALYAKIDAERLK